MQRLALCSILMVSLCACLRLSEPAKWACTTSDDCPSGEKCLDELCFASDFCRASEDCRDDEFCDRSPYESGTCTLAECGRGTQSQSICGGYACDYETYTCRTTCGFDGGCGPGFSCFENACLPDCNTTVDCPAGFGCSSNQCRPLPCGGQCAPFTCDVATDRCMTTCTSDSQCVSVAVCSSAQSCEYTASCTGGCGPYACGRDGEHCLRSCIFSSQCADGFRCSGRSCVPT